MKILSATLAFTLASFAANAQGYDFPGFHPYGQATGSSVPGITPLINCPNSMVTTDANSNVVCQPLSMFIPTLGTATPTLLIGGSAPAAITYTVQTVRYVKFGNVVEFILDVEWSALTTSAGAVTITGLPAGMTASPELAVLGFGVMSSAPPYATVNAAGILTLTISSDATAPSADAAMLGTTLGSAGGLIVTGRYFVS